MRLGTEPLGVRKLNPNVHPSEHIKQTGPVCRLPFLPFQHIDTHPSTPIAQIPPVVPKRLKLPVVHSSKIAIVDPLLEVVCCPSWRTVPLNHILNFFSPKR